MLIMACYRSCVAWAKPARCTLGSKKGSQARTSRLSVKPWVVDLFRFQASSSARRYSKL